MLPLKNLLRRKARSLFAVLQIAVAIAAFVSIYGVTQGLRAQFYRIGQVFAYDLIVMRRGAPSPIFSTISPEQLEAVRAVEGVRAASALGIQFLAHPARPQPVGFVALEPGSELMSRYRIVRGRPLSPDDRDAVVVGRLMAEQLGVDLSALAPDGLRGDPPRLELVGWTCRVVGIFESPLEEVPFLSGMGIMPLKTYRETFGRPVNLVAAHLAPGRRALRIADVQEGLRLGRALAPRIDAAVPGLKANTIEDFLDGFKQVAIVDGFALAISLLAALVSVIGVTNTMLMSVFDRTKEIGLLRAVGWSRWRILRVIEAEGAILSLAGGALGIPIGLGLIRASSLVLEGGWLEVRLDLRIYAAAVGVAVFIGLLGSFYPAARAAALQPTEALRYE